MDVTFPAVNIISSRRENIKASVDIATAQPGPVTTLGTPGQPGYAIWGAISGNIYAKCGGATFGDNPYTARALLFGQQ